MRWLFIWRPHCNNSGMWLDTVFLNVSYRKLGWYIVQQSLIYKVFFSFLRFPLGWGPSLKTVERLSARSSGSLQQSTLPRADWVHMQRQRCVDAVSRLCSLAVQGGGEIVGLHQLWKFFRVQRSTAESFQQEVSRSSKALVTCFCPPSSSFQNSLC